MNRYRVAYRDLVYYGTADCGTSTRLLDSSIWALIIDWRGRFDSVYVARSFRVDTNAVLAEPVLAATESSV